MLTPRYFFAGDFRRFYEYFLSRPHRKRNFHKGEYLWEPGSPYGNLYYIVSGTAVHGAEHESGHRKIISFHGPGTVFPGYHQADYKIELSLSMAALSELETLEFSREQFRAMFESNKELSGQVVNWYSMYVNRLLFETVHQEYNTSLVTICNLLYLLTAGQPAGAGLEVETTQGELAELLGLSRVQFTRGLAELRSRKIVSTSRGRIQVTDLAALAELCTSEVL